MVVVGVIFFLIIFSWYWWTEPTAEGVLPSIDGYFLKLYLFLYCSSLSKFRKVFLANTFPGGGGIFIFLNFLTYLFLLMTYVTGQFFPSIFLTHSSKNQDGCPESLWAQ